MLGTRNPVASLVQRRNESEVERFYGNFKIDYRFSFLESLRAVVNLGFDDESGEGFNVLCPEKVSMVFNILMEVLMDHRVILQMTSEIHF